MIEFHLLRYALAAADSGSFSRAAERFGVKQSTLSRHIQYLEDQLEFALFRRSTHGVALTDVGEKFLKRARSIVLDMEALKLEARTLSRRDDGRLRLGFQGSLNGSALNILLEDFQHRHPEIDVVPYEAPRDQLARAVEHDHLDLAFCLGDPASAFISSLCCWTIPFLAAFRPDHPLAPRSHVYWTDLTASELVIAEEDPGMEVASIITARLSGPRCEPAIRRHQVSQRNLLPFAGPNRVPIVAAAEGEFAGIRIILREVHDAFGPSRLDQRIHWRNDNQSAALQHFLTMLHARGLNPDQSASRVLESQRGAKVRPGKWSSWAR